MNTKYKILSILIFVLVIPFSLIFAQTQQVPVNFGATMFGNYTYTVKGVEGTNFNRFDLERMYLTLKSQFSEQWKVQMTADVYRNTTNGTYYSGLAVRLKFGFLDYTPFSSLSIKAGMIPGPWNSVVESLWKYRGVVSTANDKYNYVPTADLGASVTYSLPGKYGEVAGYVLNGNGYASPETNESKDVVLRATINPSPDIKFLDKLKLGGYSYIGKSGTPGLKKQRFGGLIGYSYSVILVGAEYDNKTDQPDSKSADIKGDVYSVFSEIKAPFSDLENKLSVILRVDSNDPNKDLANDKTNYFVAGLVWKADEHVAIVLDRQLTTTQSPLLKTVTGTLIDRDERWVVNAIVNF